MSLNKLKLIRKTLAGSYGLWRFSHYAEKYKNIYQLQLGCHPVAVTNYIGLLPGGSD
jgi:hypothetical protein